MKKHSVNKAAIPSAHMHSIIASQKLQDAVKKVKKHVTNVPPPDEATWLLLNKIAKESPFCYYYKSNSNDML
ncbi:MAG TPA: hypothetical protein VGM41_14655 [Chitinophagaceae bacterium]|jgi:hypothetical protein